MEFHSAPFALLPPMGAVDGEAILRVELVRHFPYNCRAIAQEVDTLTRRRPAPNSFSLRHEFRVWEAYPETRFPKSRVVRSSRFPLALILASPGDSLGLHLDVRAGEGLATNAYSGWPFQCRFEECFPRKQAVPPSGANTSHCSAGC
jgi:hypothetical protein